MAQNSPEIWFFIYYVPMKISLFFWLFTLAFFAPELHAEERFEYVRKGLLKAMIYKPANLMATSSTLLALPGCTQQAEEFFEITHLKKYADQYGFIVIVPEQSILKNPFKCWNWYSRRATKNKAETRKIMNLVKEIQSHYNLAEDKLFVMGFSAGAAMANVVASCYINDVRAVAIHDGAHYRSLNLLHPIRFIKTGSGRDLNKAVNDAFKCNDRAPTKSLAAMIIQGDDVKLIPETFAHKTFNFYKSLNERLDSRLQSIPLINSSHKENPDYPVKTKSLMIEDKYLLKEHVIENLKHTWSGGKAGYPFSNSRSIDASLLIFDFFNQYDL